VIHWACVGLREAGSTVDSDLKGKRLADRVQQDIEELAEEVRS
jgi:hypothetical protein